MIYYSATKLYVLRVKQICCSKKQQVNYLQKKKNRFCNSLCTMWIYVNIPSNFTLVVILYQYVKLMKINSNKSIMQIKVRMMAYCSKICEKIPFQISFIIDDLCVRERKRCLRLIQCMCVCTSGWNTGVTMVLLSEGSWEYVA